MNSRWYSNTRHNRRWDVKSCRVGDFRAFAWRDEASLGVRRGIVSLWQLVDGRWRKASMSVPSAVVEAVRAQLEVPWLPDHSRWLNSYP